MGGFEVDAEELKAAASALRAFASYSPVRTSYMNIAETQQIRNLNAARVVAAVFEKAYDQLTDLTIVILSLGEGLEKAAVNYGFADVWNSA